MTLSTLSTALKALSLVTLVTLAACSGGSGSGGGGYYKDDGPPSDVPANLSSIPDAVPKLEPLARGPNRPYTVMGKRYVPDTSEQPYRARGTASWYGRKFHGRKTSNGEQYDMFAMTAAHTTLPIPSYVRVTRVSNGKSVIVRVNDRGPFLHDRVIDLSYAAAHRLGMVGPGSAEVIVERITPGQIRAGSWNTQDYAVVQTEPVSTAVEEVAVATSSSASSGSGPVFLQIGAFREEPNAKALAAKAAQSMPGNLPIEVDESKNNIYRVRIGPFANRAQALSRVDQVRQSLGVTPSLSLP